MALARTVQFEVPCDDDFSRWSLSFQREGDEIIVGMHWNGKPTATHTATMSLEDFTQMSKELTHA